MVLVMAFEERYSDFNDVRDPRSDGKDPISLLLFSARYVRAESLLKVVGMLPMMEL